ncbi:aspartate aminotransferase family protein [Halalkalibacillus sediminis]|uniref:aminotransferase family protein n=1 Tax=Halalkalibacillus sediminis TaxID=2018042 RepID=UPI0013904DA9|nr:aspartate aminotransferase family protein [Halalkalibacillus sediminis]
MSQDHVFHRNFNNNYPLIERGEGVYLYDTQGVRYLDGSSGAVAVNIGHGVQEVVNAMTKQASHVAYVHTLRFETSLQHELASMIASLAPGDLDTVYFTSGGAEANESALKLARQYHLGNNDQEKFKVISHSISYHGNTMRTLSIGGDQKRKELYDKELHGGVIHLAPPYGKRSDFENLQEDEYVDYCLNQIEKKILEEDPETISCFLIEPIVGSQIAAFPMPDGYLKGIRKLCTQYNILLVADEVMTGFGRTGEMFAVNHWRVTPDIITFAKGVSSAYAPLGGMIVNNKTIQTIKDKWDGKFAHGYTFSGHPVALAAGKANINYLLDKELVPNVKQKGRYLRKRLSELMEKFTCIGDLRGRGLMLGFEIYKNKKTREPFNQSQKAAEELNQICIENGVVFYPGQGLIDQQPFDHILVAPPFVITDNEIDHMVDLLEKSLKIFERRFK